jgi:hypothetical protein
LMSRTVCERSLALLRMSESKRIHHEPFKSKKTGSAKRQVRHWAHEIKSKPKSGSNEFKQVEKNSKIKLSKILQEFRISLNLLHRTFPQTHWDWHLVWPATAWSR